MNRLNTKLLHFNRWADRCQIFSMPCYTSCKKFVRDTIVVYKRRMWHWWCNLYFRFDKLAIKYNIINSDGVLLRCSSICEAINAMIIIIIIIFSALACLLARSLAHVHTHTHTLVSHSLNLTSILECTTRNIALYFK